MYTRGPYDKQQEGGKYSHILDKRKDIISTVAYLGIFYGEGPDNFQNTKPWGALPPIPPQLLFIT
jgi:hypothetical protein